MIPGRNDKARLRRRTIGYVFQDYNLLAGLTAVENVSLPLELDGLSARKAQAAGMAVLEDLGLSGQASRYPDELSGGERQRVAIARAIVGERHLVLADEPSGALDSQNGESVMRLILAACKRGVAAVVSPTRPSSPPGPTGWCSSVTGASSTRRCRPEPRVAPRSSPQPMTTALLRLPVEQRPGDGGMAARRAVVRWAWRLFRREWRQQLLVLALITVAVAATVVGSAVATNTPRLANASFGTAQVLVTFQGSDPHLQGQLAGLERLFGPVDVIENETLNVPGSVETYDLRAQNPHGPFGGPLLSLVSGHYPAASGQVALTPGLATTLDLHVGDLWR
jgi:ABC transporter